MQRYLSLLLCCATALLAASRLSGQETARTAIPVVSDGISRPVEAATLKFKFVGTPWREVLQWLSDEGKLSLQIAELPPGTFTFSDPVRTYTPRQAQDVINQVLLKTGYALVRSGQMLFIVNYESDIAKKYIEEMSELISLAALDERSDSDIVKAFFHIGGLVPETAQLELERLVGPAGTVMVLASSRQARVTAQAKKLREIREHLKMVDGPGGVGDVADIPLKHRAADEILSIARPLLGIAEDAVDPPLRIATDMYGSRIYAMGDPTKLRQLKLIVEKVDIAVETSNETSGSVVEFPELRTYSPGIADPTTVMDVLQTQMANTPEVRLASDPKTKNIVAMARPSDHAKIKAILDTLNGIGESFEVIQLRRLDPQLAVLTINKFFGRNEANASNGPTVDGDPATNRLWVKGSSDQVKTVKDLIDKLEGSVGSDSALGDRLRILPLTGSGAQSVLGQLEQYWGLTGRENKLRIVSPSGGQRMGLPERRTPALPPKPSPSEAAPASAQEPVPQQNTRLNNQTRSKMTRSVFRLVAQRVAATNSGANGEASTNEASADQVVETDAAADQAVTNEAAESAAIEARLKELLSRVTGAASASTGKGKDVPVSLKDVVINVTPQGIILSCDDPEALAAAEELIRTLSDGINASTQPTIYWLRYAPAAATADLINSILAGDSGSGGGGSVLGNVAGSVMSELGGGILGGLLGRSGGSSASSSAVSTASGTVSIIPDVRLNALIVQASAQDLMLIDQLLEVIDRPDSPEDIKITNSAAIIPVIYQDAKKMAETVKSVYADRIQGASNNRQPSPQDLIQALTRGGGGGGRGQQKEQEPPKMTIGVDEPSNSLVVSAPQHLVAEVQALVEALDQAGASSEDEVQVITPKSSMSPKMLADSLRAMLGQKPTSSSSSSSNPSSPSDSNRSSSSSAPGTSPEEIQQRIEMFRQLRDRMQGGGGGGGPPGFGGGFPGFGGGAPGGTRGGTPGGGGTAPGGGGAPGGFRGFGGFGGGAPGGGGQQPGGNRGR